jgi:hypothetical protein
MHAGLIRDPLLIKALNGLSHEMDWDFVDMIRRNIYYLVAYVKPVG